MTPVSPLVHLQVSTPCCADLPHHIGRSVSHFLLQPLSQTCLQHGRSSHWPCQAPLFFWLHAWSICLCHWPRSLCLKHGLPPSYNESSFPPSLFRPVVTPWLFRSIRTAIVLHIVICKKKNIYNSSCFWMKIFLRLSFAFVILWTRNYVSHKIINMLSQMLVFICGILKYGVWYPLLFSNPDQTHDIFTQRHQRCHDQHNNSQLHWTTT